MKLQRNGDGAIRSQWMHRRLAKIGGPSSVTTGLWAHAATRGHLTGPTTVDAAMAVVCGIDHSNGYFFQTVVVAQKHNGWHLIAALPARDPGATWQGNIDRVRILGHTLVVHEMVHRPQDAHCCPSRAVVAEWRYRNGRLLPTAQTRRMHRDRRPL